MIKSGDKMIGKTLFSSKLLKVVTVSSSGGDEMPYKGIISSLDEKSELPVVWAYILVIL